MSLPDKDIENLLNAVRGGSDLDTACHYAGLSTAQVLLWLERGKIEQENIAAGLTSATEGNSEMEYVNFWNELSKARADAVVRNVTLIQKAAQDGSWQAAAWWLERAMPSAYGRSKNSVAAAEQPRQLPGE